MKKSLAVLLCVLLVGLVGCKNVNSNRYGSMVLFDDELYYYANDAVYKYTSEESVKVEAADSPYFDVSEQGGTVKISYRDSGDVFAETPYREQLDDAGQIVYNDEFVYARYPQGRGKIVIYRIVETEEETEKLEIVDEIEF